VTTLNALPKKGGSWARIGDARRDPQRIGMPPDRIGVLHMIC
jgi:hypothetical protein